MISKQWTSNEPVTIDYNDATFVKIPFEILFGIFKNIFNISKIKGWESSVKSHTDLLY